MDLLQVVLAAVTALILLYFYFTRNLDYWSKRGVPGPKPLPFFGNILDNFKSAINLVEVERVAKYGRIHGFFEFSKPILTIAEPELIKQITVKDFYAFPNHENEFPSDPLFSKMLPFIRDDDWRRIRTLASSTFTTKKLKQMIPLIDDCVSNVIKKLESLTQEAKIDPKVIFGAFTLDVIAKCAFAIQINGHENPNHPFLVNMRKAADFRSLRILLLLIIPKNFQKLFGCQLISEDVLAYFRNAIDAILQKRNTVEERHQNKDFVQLLMDAEISNEALEQLRDSFKDEEANENINKAMKWEKKLNKDEILANCFVFFGAGYETTSNALNYCAYSLAMNPQVQRLLFEEINDYFSERSKVDYDSLNKLIYLDAVVNETLRMYPPIANFNRVASVDYKLGDTGIMIQKGIVINLPFHAIHHDSEFHSDPFAFKPERFLSENCDNIKPFTFLPFGCGPRICIARRFALLEIKMCLAHIVNRFKFVKTAKTPEVPNFNGKKILLLCDPLYIRIEKR